MQMIIKTVDIVAKENTLGKIDLHDHQVYSKNIFLTKRQIKKVYTVSKQYINYIHLEDDNNNIWFPQDNSLFKWELGN